MSLMTMVSVTYASSLEKIATLSSCAEKTKSCDGFSPKSGTDVPAARESACSEFANRTVKPSLGDRVKSLEEGFNEMLILTSEILEKIMQQPGTASCSRPGVSQEVKIILNQGGPEAAVEKLEDIVRELPKRRQD